MYRSHNNKYVIFFLYTEIETDDAIYFEPYEHGRFFVKYSFSVELLNM